MVLSVQQAAKVVGVGKMAIFPVVHLGRIIRIPRDAFRQWLNNCVLSHSPAAEEVQ